MRPDSVMRCTRSVICPMMMKPAYDHACCVRSEIACQIRGSPAKRVYASKAVRPTFTRRASERADLDHGRAEVPEHDEQAGEEHDASEFGVLRTVPGSGPRSGDQVHDHAENENE